MTLSSYQPRTTVKFLFYSHGILIQYHRGVTNDDTTSSDPSVFDMYKSRNLPAWRLSPAFGMLIDVVAETIPEHSEDDDRLPSSYPDELFRHTFMATLMTLMRTSSGVRGVWIVRIAGLEDESAFNVTLIMTELHDNGGAGCSGYMGSFNAQNTDFALRI